MHGILLLTSLALPAQAGMVGLVRDSSTGQPLPGAVVSIPESDLRAVSDSAGAFRMAGLTSGEHTVFIRHHEYEPWAIRFRLTLADDRDVSLGVISLARAFEAIFLGTVVDSVTRVPVSNAAVSIENQPLETRTDSLGRFVLEGVRSGSHVLRIRSLGHDPWVLPLNLEVPEPMRVQFGVIPLIVSEAAVLEDIVVEGEPFSASLMMRDFMTRMRSEQGTFLTYEDIERLNPVNTSDIFRTLPGINTHRNGQVSSGRGAGTLQTIGPCVMQYYLDGVKVTASTIDVILPSVIAGIEVYSGSSTIPHIFRSQKNANCGVIAVWRKDGGHGRG